VDTHAHLDDPRFDPDRAEVLARARAAGVTSGVIPGMHAGQWARGRDLARASGWGHAVGTHPWELPRALEQGLPLLPESLEDACAIGECGLDAGVPLAMDLQVTALRAQLQRAREAGLPVILHCVRAHDALLGVLREVGCVRGVLHAYSGGAARVEAYVRAGLFLSFGGAVTWEGARRPVEAVRATPLARLLAESDAPDACPRPHRGRGEPAMLLDVIATIERLRGEPVAEALRANVAALGWRPDAR
jgi:TatD DNase family protein